MSVRPTDRIDLKQEVDGALLAVKKSKKESIIRLPFQLLISWQRPSILAKVVIFCEVCANGNNNSKLCFVHSAQTATTTTTMMRTYPDHPNSSSIKQLPSPASISERFISSHRQPRLPVFVNHSIH